MILAATRPTEPKRRPTPAELAQTFKHVRLAPRVVTRLPWRDVPRKHCDGPTCFHPHIEGSRQPEVRRGRRWRAA